MDTHNAYTLQCLVLWLKHDTAVARWAEDIADIEVDLCDDGTPSVGIVLKTGASLVVTPEDRAVDSFAVLLTTVTGIVVLASRVSIADVKDTLKRLFL